MHMVLKCIPVIQFSVYPCIVPVSNTLHSARGSGLYPNAPYTLAIGGGGVFPQSPLCRCIFSRVKRVHIPRFQGLTMKLRQGAPVIGKLKIEYVYMGIVSIAGRFVSGSCPIIVLDWSSSPWLGPVRATVSFHVRVPSIEGPNFSWTNWGAIEETYTSDHCRY